MANDFLMYASGNSSSTTLSSGMSNTDTSAPLTSDTNFSAKSGEGMVIIDEGESTEEFGYATTKSGGALTIPLANRGLEGGSAQTHASGASVKGIITAGMWNNIVDALTNLVLKTTGVLDTTKVVDLTTAQTLTNKTLTSPIINTPKIKYRTGTTTSSATPTINTDNVDFYSITAQTEAITSFTTNLSGTPVERQTLWIAITGTAARAITWGDSFENGAATLPTTTVTTTRLDVGFVWNTVTSKWRCMASG